MKVILALLCVLAISACGGAKGEPGAAGAAGQIGETGPTGATGQGLTILSKFTCAKSSGGLGFSYSGVTFSSGDVYVTCEVRGTASQVSSGRIYLASQTGASIFGCTVTFDSEGTASSGYWAFDTGATKKVTYHDSGTSIDGVAVTFADADCSLN
jgi:hypothetical protein